MKTRTAPSRTAHVPDFLILGAQKSGTTWLADLLRRQRGVFVPAKKETHFFTRRFDKGVDWYRAQFKNAHRATCVGEATPNYLAANFPEYSETPRRIHALLPNARFIIILREPVSRAVSAYMHHVMRGRFSSTSSVDDHFNQLLASKLSTAGILEFGLYAAQLERYFELFDRRRFLILDYEQHVCESPSAALTRVLEFIQAPQPAATAALAQRPNAGAQSRLAAQLGVRLSCAMRNDDTRMRFGAYVQRGCRWIERLVDAPPLTLSPDTRRRMQTFYRADRMRLRPLLGSETPYWADGDIDATHGVRSSVPMACDAGSISRT